MVARDDSRVSRGYTISRDMSGGGGGDREQSPKLMCPKWDEG